MQRVAVRLRLDFGAACAVGPGKIALLEAVDASGSLSQAARELTMSYRRAWLLLDSLNTSFARPVAVLATGGRGGGGASLTDFGRELVATYRDFERTLQAEAARRFRRIGAEVAPPASAAGPAPRRRLSRPPAAERTARARASSR
jgi:molybdate transport system regulatory protein